MTDLDKYRKQIDMIDKKLIDLLADRFSYSSRIGEIKKEMEIPVLQTNRWDDILASRKQYALKSGLNERFTVGFLQLIHDESLRIQKMITGTAE
jgi:chorismate mutase